MNDLKGIIEDCNKSDLVSDRVIKKVIEIIGQEEWQVLHDENSDVCTTMGELIITLKGIAELEKENAELKEKIKELKCCGNCQTVRNAEGVCYFLKDGTCNPRTRIKWVQKNDSKILEKQYPMI